MAKKKKEINKHTFCLLGFETGLFVVFPKRAHTDTHRHTRAVAQEHPTKPSTDKTQPPSAKLQRVPVKSSSVSRIHTSRICVLMRMYGIPAMDRCPPGNRAGGVWTGATRTVPPPQLAPQLTGPRERRKRPPKRTNHSRVARSAHELWLDWCGRWFVDMYLWGVPTVLNIKSSGFEYVNPSCQVYDTTMREHFHQYRKKSTQP